MHCLRGRWSCETDRVTLGGVDSPYAGVDERRVGAPAPVICLRVVSLAQEHPEHLVRLTFVLSQLDNVFRRGRERLCVFQGGALLGYGRSASMPYIERVQYGDAVAVTRAKVLDSLWNK